MEREKEGKLGDEECKFEHSSFSIFTASCYASANQDGTDNVNKESIIGNL